MTGYLPSTKQKKKCLIVLKHLAAKQQNIFLLSWWKTNKVVFFFVLFFSKVKIGFKFVRWPEKSPFCMHTHTFKPTEDVPYVENCLHYL